MSPDALETLPMELNFDAPPPSVKAFQSHGDSIVIDEPDDAPKDGFTTKVPGKIIEIHHAFFGLRCLRHTVDEKNPAPFL